MVLHMAPHLLNGIELRMGWWQVDNLMTPLTDCVVHSVLGIAYNESQSNVFVGKKKKIFTIYLLRLILSRFETLSSLNTQKSLETKLFRQPCGQCAIFVAILVLGSMRRFARR